METIAERLVKFTKNQGYSNYYIEKKLLLSNGHFGKILKTPMPSHKIIEKFYHTFPELNKNWLLTGEGEMINSKTYLDLEMEKEMQVVNEHKTHLSTKTNLALDYLVKHPPIPLVDVTAVAGFGNENFSLDVKDVKDYYVIPKFANEKVDFMIEIKGSSMYPKYNSGDIVACTIIKDSAYIQWNKTHVIATKYQGIMVKRIKEGKTEKSLKMISDNTSYDPFEIPVSEITGIAIVVGVVRLE
jgi:repressor LexA